MTKTQSTTSSVPATTGREPAAASESLSTVRPWGSWRVLDVGDGYQVKRITVHPHARLSLQTHAHRSEHWIVVTGVATCTVAQRDIAATEGARVDVPLGAAHRLANHEDSELIVLELQLGSYLGEDDIIRLADDYGRATQRDGCRDRFARAADAHGPA
jgi:mannose-6-phosphate isomerase